MATGAATEEKIDAGRVVQRGFETLGRHFAIYLVIGLTLIGMPTFAMHWGLLEAVESGSLSFGSPLTLATWFVSSLCGCILQATIVRSSILHLGGMSSDIGSSLGVAFRLILPMLGLSILTTWLTMFGLILLVVPGVIVYIMFIVSVPVLVEEREGVLHSMQRSRELTKGSRGRIFLLLLLFMVVYLVLTGLFAAVGAMIVSDDLLVQGALQAVTATIVSLLVAAMTASLYFELRTIKEGATTAGLAEIFA